MTQTIIGGESSVSSPHSRPQLWRIGIAGLTCAGEVPGLERRLRQVAGVEEAIVNPLTEQAYITFDPDRFKPLALISAIERAGYHAR